MPVRRLLSLGTIAAIAVGMSSCTGPNIFTRVFASGAPQAEGTVDKGKQAGDWQFFHEKGGVAARGSFAEDEQNGPWAGWYASGAIEYEGHYQGGSRDGLWRYWYENGQARSVGAYTTALQTGPWLFKREDGSPEVSGYFLDGRRALIWHRWADTGSLAEVGIFADGIPVGPWWTTDGIVDKGIPEGSSQAEERIDGRLRRWRLTLENDAVLEVQFSESGKPQVARLVDNGVSHFQTWDRSGKAVAAGALRKTSRTGVWFTYDQGKLMAVDHLSSPVEHLVADSAGALQARQAGDSGAPSAPSSLEAVADPTVQALSDLAALDKALAATPPKPPEAPSETVAELTLNADELALLTRIQPIHVAPSYWTVKEEENAQDVVELYTTGKVTRVRSTYREYNTDVDPSFPDRRPDLVGKALPQTRFIGPDGRVVDLERFKGNPVLVVILRGFAGQICLYCSQQTRVLTEFRPKFLEKKCEIVFVYPGPAAAVPVFLDAIDSLGGLQGEPPILALDVDLRLVRDLGIEKQLAQPTSIILDTEGKVGYTYVGENMVDRPSAIWLLEQLGKLRR